MRLGQENHSPVGMMIREKLLPMEAVPSQRVLASPAWVMSRGLQAEQKPAMMCCRSDKNEEELEMYRYTGL